MIAIGVKRARHSSCDDINDDRRRRRQVVHPALGRASAFFTAVVADDVGTHRLRPFLHDDDAIHLLQTERAAYDYHCSARPYELKTATPTPNAAALIAAAGPVRITALTHFDRRIDANDMFPRSIKRLHFASPYVYQIAHGALPPALEELSFGKSLLNLLSAGPLPATLTSLTLYDDWQNAWNDIPMWQAAPDGHQQMTIPSGFFPQSLVELTVNMPLIITALPRNITALALDLNFTAFSFQHFALPNLTRLKLKRFVRPAYADMFPSSVTHLHVDTHDKLVSITSLPLSLTTCIVQGLCDITADTHLPARLTTLSIAAGAQAILTLVLYPSTLTSLTISDGALLLPITAGLLPPALTHLALIGGYNQPIHVNALPPSLTHLEVSNRWNQHLTAGVLPSRLTAFHLDDDFGEFNYAIERATSILPTSLTSLTLPEAFNAPLNGLLPDSLLHLSFGAKFNAQPLTQGNLPKSLRTLIFPHNARYRQRIVAHALPSLLELHLGSAYTEAFDADVLPPSLTQLVAAINAPLSALHLPFALRELRLTSFNAPIAVGELPPSLTALTLDSFDHELSEGVLPASLKRLVLPSYSQRLSRAILPTALTELTAPFQYRRCATGRIHFTSNIKWQTSR